MSSSPATSLALRSAPLDLLRTIAIALVFTSHFRNFAGHDWFNGVSEIGWAGVDLFFVLSGFLISSQLIKNAQQGKISLKEFYLRRGFRIWPNYLAVLILYFGFPLFVERNSLAPLWRYLTFTLNFGLDYRKTGAFSHAWSLCVEEHFYLILPFLLMLLAKYGTVKRCTILFISIFLGGMCLRYSLWQHFITPYFYVDHHRVDSTFFREIYYPTYCRLDSLSMGVAIAAIYRLKPQWWEKLNKKANVVLAAGLIFLGAAYFVCLEEVSWQDATFGYPLLGLGFSCLTMAALFQNGVFSKIRIPFVKLTATLAFSFYLVHKTMIHLSKQWLISNGVESTSILYPLGIFMACLIPSLFLYFAVERPFLKIRDRLGN
jgi:peptidoglycan/LPS O-acetylase OafA/YrhL